MLIPRQYRKVVGLILGVLGLCLLAGALMNSTAYSEVRVTKLQGTEEPRDASMLGLGADTVKPDYNLELRVAGRWIDCGTYDNRSMGDGLEFEVRELAPKHATTEIRLQEKDKLDSDLLEQMPITGSELTGKGYSFALQSRFDPQAGISWFFSTPIGRIIALGMLIAVILIFLASFGGV